MDKIHFQNNTVIPPEWLNAIQDLSYDKEPGEAGYIPNPDDFFHFKQWRTFTIDADNRITLGDYQRNVIIVPSAKEQSVTLDHFPTNGLIIYAPDWDAESDSTAVTIVGRVGVNYITLPVIKGGVGIFLCSGQLVISRSLISSSAHSLATLKSLYVDDLIVESDLTLPASSILSTHIANGAVTTDKIGSRAVISSKIALLAVREENIDTAAVTAGKIGTGAVTTDKIGTAAVSSIKIDTNAIAAVHIQDNAVETDKIKDKAITSEKLADQLAFVKTPKFPRKIYRIINVTESASYDIIAAHEGTIFSTAGTHTIELAMHFSDADSRFQAGDTYRVHNNTPNEIRVRDWTIDETFTKIPAWTVKDFYYRGNAWDLA